MDLKDKVIDVSYGKGSGSSVLVIGEEEVALIDCGMAYCAEGLIENIKKILGDNKSLDYLFLSHSHYDHIGAMPYIKQIWPSVKVLGALHAQYILSRENALKTIKELSKEATRHYNIEKVIEYNNDYMKVDQAIFDQETIDLGGIDIKVLETPGHTKCSLSFLIGGEILMASETSGTLKSSGEINPTFIISYDQTIDSIAKCRQTQSKYIISPHTGFITADPEDYWEKCIKAVRESADLVLKLHKKGYTEEEIFNDYKEVYYDEEIRSHQPESAFELNTKAMIKVIIK